jgi:hypothetical protein
MARSYDSLRRANNALNFAAAPRLDVRMTFIV